MMHFDLQTMMAAGIGIHLLAALAKAVWKTPQQQAQIDAIERKIDAVLGRVQTP